MVAIRAGAREVPVLKPADVRFGSKADICSAQAHVRFTPNSDIDCVFRHVRFGPKADIGTSITFRLTFAGRLRNRLSALIAHIREMVFQASLDTAAPRPNVCAILFNVRSASLPDGTRLY